MQLFITIIVAFIEGFLMLGAGLGIIGSRLHQKTMIFIAILYAFITYGVRQFYVLSEIPFGTHTFVLMGSMIILLVFLGKQHVLDSFVCVLIGLVHVFLGETLFFFPLMQFVNIDPIAIAAQPIGAILMSLVVYIPLFITFTIGYIFKKTLIDFNSFKISDRM